MAEARLTELNEPRYFVALLAYDYQKLRNGTSAGGAKSAPQPVWSVRFNASADNNNFMKALPAMSRIAASYFGRQLDELKIEPLSLAKN